MDDEFEVPAAEFRYEDEPTKGSRFIASVAPATTAEEAIAYIESVRAEGPGANHHCWAYRVGKPCSGFRFNDDGEPGGSAGRPILQQLEGHGLDDVVCVVTRYFGGTKLGVGGLVRAYGGCAARALDRAPTRTHVTTRSFTVSFPYEFTGPIQGLLAARNIEPVGTEYGETVRMSFEVPERDADSFVSELRDRTSGRLLVNSPG